MTLDAAFPTGAVPTIPPEIREELVMDAKLTTHLGDTVKGEPMLDTPGTRARNALWKLGVNIVEKIFPHKGVSD